MHPQPQPSFRLDSDKTRHLYGLAHICGLKPEPRHQRREQTFHLQLCETLPNTAPRPVQEGDVRKRALCTTCGGVGTLQPAIRNEFGGVGTPEDTAAVDRPWGNRHGRALGDGDAADGGRHDGFAYRVRRRGVKTKSFVADGGQEGHSFGIECRGVELAHVLVG